MLGFPVFERPTPACDTRYVVSLPFQMIDRKAIRLVAKLFSYLMPTHFFLMPSHLFDF